MIFKKPLQRPPLIPTLLFSSLILLIILLSYDQKKRPPVSTITSPKTGQIKSSSPPPHQLQPSSSQKDELISSPLSSAQQIRAMKIERHGRELIGALAHLFKGPQKELKMVNQINSKWKEALSHRIGRFDEQLEVVVNPIASLIQVESATHGRYVEYVFIQLKRKEKEEQGFNALIDSMSGKIIDSWHHNKLTTLHEQSPSYPILNHEAIPHKIKNKIK